MRILLFFLIALTAVGQNEKGGVFLTFNDYVKDKLKYEINCKTDKETFRLNEFLNKNHITLIHNKQKVKLYKDSIYGFKACYEPLVRFQNKTHYKLAEKGPIWIFYIEIDALPKKGYKQENPYQYNTTKQYYYSVTGDGKLLPLTTDNLKLSFQNNPEIISMLENRFKQDNISEYDSINKMFKLNYLLQQILSKN